jgi:hypothetical protein
MMQNTTERHLRGRQRDSIDRNIDIILKSLRKIGCQEEERLRGGLRSVAAPLEERACVRMPLRSVPLRRDLRIVAATIEKIGCNSE